MLLVVALATLYKVALPRKPPWYRGLPGAALAMVVFLLASVGIRVYLIAIGRTGYTYGALAAPIAFLLFTFFIGLAIVIGAHFNSAIQEMWPARLSPRRRWFRLEKKDKKPAEPEPERSESGQDEPSSPKDGQNGTGNGGDDGNDKGQSLPGGIDS